MSDQKYYRDVYGEYHVNPDYRETFGGRGVVTGVANTGFQFIVGCWIALGLFVGWLTGMTGDQWVDLTVRVLFYVPTHLAYWILTEVFRYNVPPGW